MTRVIAMCAIWHSPAYAAQIDRPIDEIKSMIAASAHCEWEDRSRIVADPDDPLADDTRCAYYFLRLKDGRFYTLNTGYLNPGENTVSESEAHKYRDGIIKMLTALLPEWKEARAWLEDNVRLAELQADEGYVGAKEVGDAWVVVAVDGINGTDHGATAFYITKNPNVLKYVRHEYVYPNSRP